MAKASVIFVFLLCCFISNPVKATIECTVDGKVISKSKHTPCPFITLFVKQGNQIVNYNPCKTDKKGNFILEFNVGGWGDTSLANDKSAWLNFYAVRSKGDTVLLQSFFDFPKSFKFIEDQHFRTTFYLK